MILPFQKSALVTTCLGVLVSAPFCMGGPTNNVGTNAAASVVPAWRVYDDPSVRGDHRWMADFDEHATLIEEYEAAKKPHNARYVTLRGAYAIPVPTESGRAVRIRFNQSNLKNTRLTFRSGTNLYQVAQDRTHRHFLSAGRVVLPSELTKGKQSGVHPVHRLTDDGGLWQALADGLMDLRYQDAHFIVARGPRVLLSFPVEPAPMDMVLAGEARLDLFRVLDLPPLEWEQGALHAPPEELQPAALMPWRLDSLFYGREDEDAARLVRHEDGSIELFSSNTPCLRTAEATFRSESPMVITLKILSASAGAGVYLPGPNRSPLKFYIGKLNGRNVICRSPHDLGKQMSPFQDLHVLESPFFCRATYGLDFVQIDFSNDGRTWVTHSRQALHRHHAFSPLRVAMVLGGTRRQKHNAPGPEQSIRLSAVAVDTFRLLEGLVDPAILSGVPPDSSGHEWRMACNRALINGWAPAELRQKAVDDFLMTAVDAGVAPGRVLQCIRSLVPFMQPPQKYGNTSSSRLAGHLDGLGNRMLMNGQPELAAEWLDLWYELDTYESRRVRGRAEVSPPPIIRGYLYGLRHEQEWEELLLRSLEYMFFARPEKQNLLASWMLDQALDHLDGVPREEAFARKQYWLHPLRIMTDRQTANLLNELAAATANDEFERACRILIQEYDKDALSLSGDDDGLYMPAQDLLRDAIRSEPELQDVLVEQFGRIGLIRVNRAVEQGTLDQLEQIVVQFHGTEAARKALAILADRSLSLGHFVKAAGQYDELIPSLSGAERTSAVAKRNLALAMSGRRPPEAVTETVSFPGGSFTSDQYGKLIESVLVHRAEEDGHAPGKPWGPWPAGETPTVRQLTDLPFFAASPVGVRQKDKYLLLQQGGALSAIDVDGARAAWSHGSVDAKSALFSFRPLVLEDRVFAALSEKKGEAVLKCLQLDKGNVLWERKLVDLPAADPFKGGRDLFLLSHSFDEHLVLQRINPANGEPEFTQHLLRHRHEERRRDNVRAIASDRRVVVSAAGMLICCDDLGRIRWVRRIACVPAEADPALSEFYHSDDLVGKDGRIVVCGPGAPELVCVDAETGSVVWTKFQPQRRRLLGLAGETVVVRNITSIEAVSIADGKTKWHSPANREGVSRYLGDPGKLLNIRFDVAEMNNKRVPGAVRSAELLSAADGTPIASWDLPHDVLPRSDIYAAFGYGRKVLLLTGDDEKKRANKEPSAQLCVVE